MSSKWRHFWGTVTIVAIVGGTIYAIKKSKDAEKTEGEEISLEEAKDIVARGQINEEVDAPKVRRLVATSAIPYAGDTVINADTIIRGDIVESVANHDVLSDEEEEDEEILEEDEPTEEDGELRYDPNSKEALNQYIRMELAEWRPLEDSHQTMVKLFDFPFRPMNDGDDILRSQIADFRAQFFGTDSRWANEVTIADIILHYARAAEFNCGESVKYWVEYFLDFNELDFTMSSHEIDEMIQRLNSHTYFNEERQTFGLFGLTRDSMDQAIRIANRNVDRSVTYEHEFNEFLKSCL
jgi:hypothetical protein